MANDAIAAFKEAMASALANLEAALTPVVPPPVDPPVPPAPPPSTDVLVDVGNTGGVMANWLPDIFTDGFISQLDVTQIVRAPVNPAPLAVMANGRRQMTTGHVLTSPGKRLVRMHFIDHEATGVGQRIFDVKFGGITLVSQLDIYAKTGARYTEWVEDVVFIDPGGQLDVTFVASVGAAGILCDIEFLDGTGMALTVPVTGGGGGGGPVTYPNDSFFFELFPNITLSGTPTLTGTETSIKHYWLSAAPFGTTGPGTPVVLLPAQTFTAADGTAPTGWTVHTSGSSSRGDVRSNTLELDVGPTDGTSDYWAYASNGSVNSADVAMYGTAVYSATNMFGSSMWVRDFGEYATGPHGGYMLGVEPINGRITLGKRDGIDHSGTGGDPHGTFTTITTQSVSISAGVTYYWRVQVTGDTILGYFGTTPFVQGVTAWTITGAGGGLCPNPGKVSLWNGDHGLGASGHTPTVRFDNVQVDSTTATTGGVPAGNTQTDNLTIRWSGNFNFTATTWTFKAIVDDGVRIYVDGVLKMDHWIQEADTTYTVNVVMTAGYHLIQVEYLELAGYADIEVSWYVTVTPPPPPPPPPPGGMRAGYFFDDVQAGQAVTASQQIGHDVPVLTCYVDLTTSGGEVGAAAHFIETNQIGNWLAVDNTRLLEMALHPLLLRGGFQAGNWGDTRVEAAVANVCNYLVQVGGRLGFNPAQVLIKFGEEANGNYGYEYQPLAQGGSGQIPGYIDMCHRSYTAMKNVSSSFKMIQCFNLPYTSDPAPFATYWGDAWCDGLTLDTYDDDAYTGSVAGDFAVHQANMDQFFTFAAAHSKTVAVSENALCNPSAGRNGHGDNPYYVKAIRDYLLSKGCLYIVEFHSNVAETGMTLDDAPQSQATIRTWWANHP